MSSRGGVVRFFLFLFLSLIILFQILSMVQSDRFYESLNRLDDVLRGKGAVQKRPAGVEEYPGDEGDWLVWAFRVEPKTLNQYAVDSDIYSRWITTPYIVEPLLMYNFDDLTMEPWLAESYEVSEDGLEITFKLRDDIYFSDDVPVTSDDVIFTYETAIDPKVDAANIASLYIDIDKVIRVDERVVKFVMKRPYFKALENVSFWDLGILPKHIYEFKDAEEFNKRVSNPVGSGPYVFERWDVGQQIVLRRNENYWGPKPKLKKIVFKFITNAVAAVQALRSHEVDIIIPEPEQFAELVEDGEFNKEFVCLSYWNPGVPFFWVGWNQKTEFFGDRRVRIAMTHIIDRDRIVSELMKGYGRTITGPFNINSVEYDKSIEAWPYDLEKAKGLLTEAGWVDRNGDGIRDKGGAAFRFKITYSTGNVQYERLAKLIKDDAAKVGIGVEAEPLEWSILLPRVTDGKFDAVMMGWGGDVLEDFYSIFHSSQIGKRGYNIVRFSNKEADELLERIRRTMDRGARVELCHRFHRIMHEEQPYTFLFTRPTFRPMDRRFKDVKIYTLGPKYWEWYVPKEQQRYK